MLEMKYALTVCSSKTSQKVSTIFWSIKQPIEFVQAPCKSTTDTIPIPGCVQTVDRYDASSSAEFFLNLWLMRLPKKSFCGRYLRIGSVYSSELKTVDSQDSTLRSGSVCGPTKPIIGNVYRNLILEFATKGEETQKRSSIVLFAVRLSTSI